MLSTEPHPRRSEGLQFPPLSNQGIGAGEMAVSLVSIPPSWSLPSAKAICPPSLHPQEPLTTQLFLPVFQGEKQGAREWGRGGQLQKSGDGEASLSNRVIHCTNGSPSLPSQLLSGIPVHHTQQPTCKQQLLHPQQTSLPAKSAQSCHGVWGGSA